MGDRGPQPPELPALHRLAAGAKAQKRKGVRGEAPSTRFFENNLFRYFLPFFRMGGIQRV
nr:MAG TPA: hypothetical protein [Caudoviricetes sp.]